MKLPAKSLIAIAVMVPLFASSIHSGIALTPLLKNSSNGPSADYPMVIGAPFDVFGVTYTPVDQMNYDAVGIASIGTENSINVSAAHKTLPLPSYVEVTSLETGRTILVRIERRGPLNNTDLIELSPKAATQLGMAINGGEVRVRRVNPQEIERQLLRTGQNAPVRMDTPPSLLAALKRKLPSETAIRPVMMPPTPHLSPSSTPAGAQEGTRMEDPTRPKPVVPTRSASDASKPAQARPAAAGTLYVQIGAYSTKSRADANAARVKGQTSRADNIWRVRKGPYSHQSQAQAALAEVRSRGYTDARILSAP